MGEIEERKFNRLLKVFFTDAEKVEMVGEAGRAYSNQKKAENDLATVKAQYQAKIKEHEAEISSLFERVNSGWEMRSVPCREIKDYGVGAVVVFRDDTQEVIEERAMTFDERQQELPFEEGPIVDAEMPVSDSEHPTVAEAQADAQSEAGERMATLEKPHESLPEDTNPFYLGAGKKEGQDA